MNLYSHMNQSFFILPSAIYLICQCIHPKFCYTFLPSLISESKQTSHLIRLPFVSKPWLAFHHLSKCNAPSLISNRLEECSN